MHQGSSDLGPRSSPLSHPWLQSSTRKLSITMFKSSNSVSKRSKPRVEQLGKLVELHLHQTHSRSRRPETKDPKRSSTNTAVVGGRRPEIRNPTRILRKLLLRISAAKQIVQHKVGGIASLRATRRGILQEIYPRIKNFTVTIRSTPRPKARGCGARPRSRRSTRRHRRAW